MVTSRRCSRRIQNRKGLRNTCLGSSCTGVAQENLEISVETDKPPIATDTVGKRTDRAVIDWAAIWIDCNQRGAWLTPWWSGVAVVPYKRLRRWSVYV